MIPLKLKSKMKEIKGRDSFSILIRGNLPGRGFSEFVSRLAERMDLKGWVAESSLGAKIEIEGDKEKVYEFISRLYQEKSPIIAIEGIQVEEKEESGYEGFEIRKFIPQLDSQLFLPDLGICRSCLDELFNPKNRRYLYPFINCSYCGPRFSIVRDRPYSRENSSMSEFEMCARCQREYEDPKDRRFKNELNSCWECGPSIWLSDKEGEKLAQGLEVIEKIALFLKEGKVLVVKNTPGYQLFWMGEKNRKLFSRFKNLKVSFVLLACNIRMVEELCRINQKEKDLLSSFLRPVVILRRKVDSTFLNQLMGESGYLKVKFPSQPLEYLILKYLEVPWVMLSENILARTILDEQEAFQELREIADYFLTHQRKIHFVCGSSLSRVYISRKGKIAKECLLVPAGGYAPVQHILERGLSYSMLATGTDSSNTFALAKDNSIFLSPCLGNLTGSSGEKDFERQVQRFAKMLGFQPDIIVSDLSSDYSTSRYARRISSQEGKRLLLVQHQHAHLVSSMFENRLEEKVFGVVFDNPGQGAERELWGGEIMISDREGFQRIAHLEHISLPEQEATKLTPAQMGVCWLYQTLGEKLFELEIDFLQRMGEERLRREVERFNLPSGLILSSSLKNLLLALSAIIGLSPANDLEDGIEIKFEEMAEEFCKESYEFSWREEGGQFIILTSDLLREMISDLRKGVSARRISAKFQNGLAEVTSKLLQRLRRRFKINKVCLSGEVFQNLSLLEKLEQLLSEKGFEVYLHGKVPPNDAGISLGQLIIGNELLKK